MNSQTKVIIRADGGKNVGMGHFFRCISIAEMLKDNFYLVFATRNPNNFQKKEILSVCHSIIELPDNESHFDEFLPHVSKENIVVLDNYFFDTAYQKSIIGAGAKLVCIDDIVDKAFVADYIINHATVNPVRYQALPTTQIKTGVEYAILRRSFLDKAKKNRDDKDIYKFERVFISFGADPYNITRKCLEQLVKFEFIKEINVVTSSAFTFQEDLKKVIEGSSGVKIKHFDSITSEEILNVMVTSDFAITPCSSLLYEILALRKPVMAGYYVDNQLNIYRGLKEETIKAVDLGDLKSLSITKEHFNIISQLSTQTPIDGFSDKRILKLFLELELEIKLSIRIAASPDVDLLFNWANDKTVRENALNPEKIEYDSHVNWYNKQLESKDSFIYIFSDDNRDVGMVRFNIAEKKAVITFSLNQKSRGKGYGKAMLRLAMLQLLKDLKDFTVFVAEVSVENSASNKIFLSLGYILTRKRYFKGKEFNLYELKNRSI